MKAKLDADQTDELFSKTSNLIEEAILRFTENGLEMTTADPAMVSMIHLEVPEDSFEEYEVDTEDEDLNHLVEEGTEGILVGVNIENLSAVASMFDEEITFEVEGNQFILTEGSDRYELPILNLSTDDIPNMDELDFKLGAELENSQFKTLRKKLAVASDSTYMELDSEGVLEVEAEGSQISVETSFQLENTEVYEDESDEGEEVVSAESMFALEYLQKAERMFNSLETCDSTVLKMGDDFPLTMEHEDNRENLTFVLAPRIEEE